MIFILLEGMLRLTLYAHSSIKKHQSLLEKNRVSLIDMLHMIRLYSKFN